MLLGIDFSGPSIQAGLVEKGGVLSSRSEPVPPGATPSEILDLIAALARSLAREPDAVGVAIPGEVNMEGLCWRLPNAPGFEGVSIGEEVAGRLNCPIAVENRATAAALGERLFGYGRRYASFLMVTLGAGVGGGLVIGRQLYPGFNGFGAEIGHMAVDSGESAPLCSCGQKGCLEAFVGARGVLRTFEAYGGRALDLAGVEASARRGEVPGIMTFEVFARYLGRGLSSIQNLLDLNAVVLSGAMAACFDIFEQKLRAELRERCFAGLLAEVPILVSELGENATVIGAAHLTEL